MRLFAKILAAFAALVAMPAHAADWFLAETDHFKIYSRDSKSSTEEFAQDLERLDEVLRIISGVGPDDGSLPPSSKVIAQLRRPSLLAPLSPQEVPAWLLPQPVPLRELLDPQ